VIQVVNTGLLEHDFVVDELGIDAPLPIGETIEVAVPDDAPVGESFEFYCSIAGHRSSGMEGTITIVEAPAGPEAQGGPSEAVEVPPAEVSEDVAALMEDPSVVALEATDPYNWSRKAIDAAPGQVIRVINYGVLEHDFVIDELDIKQELPFGEPIDIQVPEDVAVGDTYLYYCSIPGHRELGMEGTLTIVETAATPVASQAASPEASPVAEGGAVAAISTVDLAFEPAELAIPAEVSVVITLQNDGALEHDFVIEDTEFKTDLIAGGGTGEVAVTLPAGEYVFYCSVTGHREAGMEGTLTVG
jgi:uncharacterized cupredoxin-like copper-binding protein